MDQLVFCILNGNRSIRSLVVVLYQSKVGLIVVFYCLFVFVFLPFGS